MGESEEPRSEADRTVTVTFEVVTWGCRAGAQGRDEAGRGRVTSK